MTPPDFRFVCQTKALYFPLEEATFGAASHVVTACLALPAVQRSL
jgi:hypothetical protein